MVWATFIILFLEMPLAETQRSQSSSKILGALCVSARGQGRFHIILSVLIYCEALIKNTPIRWT